MNALSETTIRLVALGGLGEIGMNCLVLEAPRERGGDIVLVDCGVTFPSTDLGIDVYHPRFDFLLAHRDRVRGVVLTHGHEDHIGGLPYLLRNLDVPVWGPAHALALARMRAEEHGFANKDLRFSAVKVRESFDVGSFSFEAIRVTHSIVDAVAFAIRTPAGLIVHTGDFKLDPTPPDGEVTDEARLRELGKEGVRLLLSDSTNVDAAGSATSERDVGDALHELVSTARTRVVIGMFASNIHRLARLFEIAERTKRRICLLGRSVQNHARTAEAIGRLRNPGDLLVSPDAVRSLGRDRVLVIASGTQAERLAALTKLATATHPFVTLEPGDLVVLSSRIIPGNDRAVYDMMASFLRGGIELVTRITDHRVHASGHAHRDEQTRMIELTEPRGFIPLHGTLHHLVRHAALARDIGVADAVVAENGEIVEVAGGDGAMTKRETATVGRVATARGETLSDDVLRERALLGRGGAVFVALVVDGAGLLVAPPSLVAHGVIDASDTEVLRNASKAVARAVSDSEARTRSSDELLIEVARLAARRAIEASTGHRAIVRVTITRV